MTAAAFLAARVRAHRFVNLSEATLRQGVYELLGGDRDATPSAGGRIDLLVDDVAVLVKVEGSAEAVLRQVQTYRSSPEIREVLIVSTCSGHAHLPAAAGGKALAVAMAKGARP